MPDSAVITADETIEAKAITEEPNGDLVIEGYASTWDTDRQGERFVPGGFRDCIKAFLDAGGPLMYQHKDGEQLGQVEHLEERAKGLWMRARVPRPPDGTDAFHRWSLLKRGMLRGLSVRGKMLKRGAELLMKDLYEISSTPSPVNAGGLLAVGAKALSDEPAPDEGAAARAWMNERFEEAQASLAALESRLAEATPPDEGPAT